MLGRFCLFTNTTLSAALALALLAPGLVVILVVVTAIGSLFSLRCLRCSASFSDSSRR